MSTLIVCHLYTQVEGTCIFYDNFRFMRESFSTSYNFTSICLTHWPLRGNFTSVFFKFLLWCDIFSASCEIAFGAIKEHTITWANVDPDLILPFGISRLHWVDTLALILKYICSKTIFQCFEVKFGCAFIPKIIFWFCIDSDFLQC